MFGFEYYFYLHLASRTFFQIHVCVSGRHFFFISHCGQWVIISFSHNQFQLVTTGFLNYALFCLSCTLESKTSKLFDNEKVEHGQAPRIYLDNVISTEKTTRNNHFDLPLKTILDIIHRSNHCL
jgi:hypothetical protein